MVQVTPLCRVERDVFIGGPSPWSLQALSCCLPELRTAMGEPGRAGQGPNTQCQLSRLHMRVTHYPLVCVGRHVALGLGKGGGPVALRQQTLSLLSGEADGGGDDLRRHCGNVPLRLDQGPRSPVSLSHCCTVRFPHVFVACFLQGSHGSVSGSGTTS